MLDEITKLPEGWSITTLSELGEWLSGGTPSRSHAEYYGGDIPWVKTGNLADGLILEIDESITLEGLVNSSAKVFPSGSLLVAMYGATIGKLGILQKPAATNQACAALISKGITTEIVPYLFYYLLSRREDLKNIGQGGAQPNISQTIIKDYPCPLAPLNEQRRIVVKIDALMARSQRVKEALEAIPPLLDQFRQSVLAAAFRGDLTAEWREKNLDVEPAPVLLERIRAERRCHWEEAELEKMKVNGKTPKDDKWKNKYQEPDFGDTSDLFDLPEGWVWVKAEQLCWQITDGEHIQPPYQSKGFPMLTAKHVRDGFVNMADAKFISKENFEKCRLRCAPETGDLLIVSVGATTGRAAIVFDCPPFALVRSVLLLKPLSSARFLLNWIKSRWCQFWISTASGATAQAHLYINDTKRMPVPLPPEAEQNEIIRRVDAMIEIADSIENCMKTEISRLATLNQSILAKAFRGELVPQDPNDEPASVLLEHIRAERAKRETEAKVAKKSTGKTSGQRGRKAKQQDLESIQLGLPGLE